MNENFRGLLVILAIIGILVLMEHGGIAGLLF